LSGIVDGGKRVFAFFAGIFLIAFVMLGYETKQISLIGFLFYDLVRGLYNVIGFFEARSYSMPFSLSAATSFIAGIIVVTGFLMIVGAILGGGKGHSSSS
jgi:hypothetical protein